MAVGYWLTTMQFQVPQFIETEAKIIGPFTLKQFLYIAVAGILSFICFFLFKIVIWAILTALFGLAAIALAFLKYNGQPLPRIIGYALRYIWKPHFYLWRKIEEAPALAKLPGVPAKRGTESLLRNLWLSLETSKHPVENREKRHPQLDVWSRTQDPKERFQILPRITGEREAARRIDYR